MRTRMQVIIRETQDESQNLRAELNRENDRRQARLDALIDSAENCDIAQTSFRDIAALYRIQLEFNQEKSKLFGLYHTQNETSRDSNPKTDTDVEAEDREADIDRENDALARWLEERLPLPEDSDAIDRQIETLDEIIEDVESES